jgi:diguanylate cyclase (GGDEF)-like protein
MDLEKYEELKHTGKLPSPTGVGMRLLLLTAREDCSIDELVHTIQADPALTGRIVKLATSALHGSSGRVSSVKEAAVRLGLRSVSNVAVGFSLISGNRQGRCPSFDYDGYWATSLAHAVGAQIVAREFDLGQPAEAFTCALLCRVGRLALASVHPDDYGELLRKAAADKDLVRLEREAFSLDNRELSAALLEDWGLPAYYAETVLHFEGRDEAAPFEHAQTERMLKVLDASWRFAEICRADPERQPALWPSVRDAWAGLGRANSDAVELFDRMSTEWREWGGLLDLKTQPVLPGRDLERRGDPKVEDLPGARPGGPGLRILAVDDDPTSLKLLGTILEQDGHEVLTAANGREALAVALEQHPQMVITDWMMPEMDGIELCKHLRRMEEGKKLYILILTGRTEEERIVEAFDAGADDYIVKPFKKRLLLARIKPGLRVTRLQEDNDRQVREKEERNAQLMKAERRLRSAAMTDSLTDLPNRRYAMKRLEQEWCRAGRVQTPLSLVMLDIDHFKSVNDRFGHDVGDHVLQSTARTIHRMLRRGDTCARMGGEEFLLICPNTTAEAAMLVAERIRAAVEAQVVQAGGFQGSVTLSLGVGTMSPETPTIDSLVKVADEAVYEAKRSGRNRSVMGRPSGRERRSA